MKKAEKKTNQIAEETLEATSPKPKKKRKWWVISLEVFAGLVLVGVGIYGGQFLGKMAFYRTVNYGNYWKTKELYDYTKAREKSQAIDSSTYYSRFNPTELVNIGLLNLSNSEHYYGVTRGWVNAKVSGIQQKQDILQTFIKNGDQYFEEDISYGIVKTALRFYQNSYDDITVYSSKSINKISTDPFLYQANYNLDKYKKYTGLEFHEVWGRYTLSDPIVYFIDDQTVVNGTKTKNDDGSIDVHLVLDLRYSVLKYARQMKETGGLNSMPTFKKVELDFSLNKDLYITSYTTDEEYVAQAFGVPADSSGSLTMEYVYSERNIPSMDEETNFEK